MTFEETMLAARSYRQLNYTELARHMGKPNPTVYGRYLSQVERGLVRPSYDTVGEIAEALDVEFHYRPGTGWGWRPNR